ncbi:hypothetical protein LXL04_015334 [Taraxacum kok-saghyz]
MQVSIVGFNPPNKPHQENPHRSQDRNPDLPLVRLYPKLTSANFFPRNCNYNLLPKIDAALDAPSPNFIAATALHRPPIGSDAQTHTTTTGFGGHQEVSVGIKRCFWYSRESISVSLLFKLQVSTSSSFSSTFFFFFSSYYSC